MSAMLTDVVDRGTGWQARNVGFRQPAAGKTGPTNDYRDAWFVGYTPDLVAGVWVGFDRPRTIMAGGYAGDLAVPIWGAFMRDATAGTTGRSFKRPSGLVAIEICQDSGLLPGRACQRVPRVSRDGETREASAVAVEYFRRGTEPSEHCPLHDESWFGGVRTAAFDPSAFPRASTVGAPDRQSAAEGDTAPRDTRGVWSRFLGAFKRGGER
jgi:penicillin-binding protein 1A